MRSQLLVFLLQRFAAGWTRRLGAGRPHPLAQDGLTHAQRLGDARCRLSILSDAADCFGPKGRIIFGSLLFTGGFCCFHDKGKLLSPCPLLPDHLNSQALSKADSQLVTQMLAATELETLGKTTIEDGLVATVTLSGRSTSFAVYDEPTILALLYIIDRLAPLKYKFYEPGERVGKQ